MSRPASSDAALVLDETFSTAANANLPLESRSAMAYWQNGKLYMHCSTQSTAQTVPAVARWVGIEPSEVVIISEYTGGGFGSKVAGSITMAIPALLSKKANAPVMMRINQEEEHYIGRVRPAFHGRVKIGFAKDGRITALDLYWLADNGPYEQQHDCGTGARMASLIYQPPAMSFRGMSVVTNTNPTGSQSQPGGMNAVAIIEPVLAKAARQLGIDQVADAADQRAGGAGAGRTGWCERPPRHGDQRVREGGARSRRRAVRVGGAQGTSEGSARARRCAGSASR